MNLKFALSVFFLALIRSFYYIPPRIKAPLGLKIDKNSLLILPKAF